MQREPELDTKAQMLIATGSPSGFLAFGLGAGLSPKAPGTAGTLAGMLLGLPLAGLPVWAGLLFVAIAFLVGIPVCDRVSKRLGVHDHGGFGIMLDDLIAALYAAAVLGSGGWLVGWLTG